MKIGVISSSVFALDNEQSGISNYGGLEVIAWHCARGLALMNHDVYLFAPDRSVCPGVTIVPFGPAGAISEHQAYGGFPNFVDQQGKVVREKHSGYWPHLLKLDCIIDHTWQKYSIMLKAEGRLKAPCLLVCHAPINTMFASPPPVEKPCLVAISKDQGNHAEALWEKEVRVCHNGIDTDFYKHTGCKRTDRFLFLARFSTVKSPHLAIQACLDSGVGLDMVGDTSITNEPDYFRQCCQLAEQSSPNWDHSKGKQIKIIGGVSRGESVYYFSQAKALLHLNSVFREPFGLAPVESMLCGCPVIAWKKGAMPETIEHGKTGFIVNSLGEVAEIIRNNKIDTLDRDYCREWATKFSIQTMINRYNSLVEEAVNTGGW